MSSPRFWSPIVFLKPDDGPDVTYEFFSPFAHIEGRYEWCRIRSPTHGVFDCFIVLGDPAAVYVNSNAGERFMGDRYPEVRTFRVAERKLELRERGQGRTVEGELAASEGPVRKVKLLFHADPAAVLRHVPYGGEGKAVWGSRRWTCWGVDLVLDANVTGFVETMDGRREVFEASRALLTLGSFGRIAPFRPPRSGRSPYKNREGQFRADEPEVTRNPFNGAGVAWLRCSPRLGPASCS